jgi:hypothetical protein
VVSADEARESTPLGRWQALHNDPSLIPDAVEELRSAAAATSRVGERLARSELHIAIAGLVREFPTLAVGQASRAHTAAPWRPPVSRRAEAARLLVADTLRHRRGNPRAAEPHPTICAAYPTPCST